MASRPRRWLRFFAAVAITAVAAGAAAAAAAAVASEDGSGSSSIGNRAEALAGHNDAADAAAVAASSPFSSSSFADVVVEEYEYEYDDVDEYDDDDGNELVSGTAEAVAGGARERDLATAYKALRPRITRVEKGRASRAIGSLSRAGGSVRRRWLLQLACSPFLVRLQNNITHLYSSHSLFGLKFYFMQPWCGGRPTYWLTGKCEILPFKVPVIILNGV